MLDGKRIAILAEEGFEDTELLEPMRAMREADARVMIIGSGTSKTYHGKRGQATVTVNANADEVRAKDFDAIIVPGGHAPDRMRLHPAMINLVKEGYDAGEIIAAICHGPQLLISADVVKGHHVTSWPSIAVDLKNAGASWVDEPVVVDGNIITARKPADIPKFNRAVIEALQRTSDRIKPSPTS